MRSLAAVLFDLDGTLVDSAPDLRRAVNRLLEGEGRRPLALDEVIGMVGDGAAKLVERALAATGPAPAGSELAAMTGRFLDLYEGHTAIDSRPYPGVADTLARLAADGVALAVCTNKPERASRELLAALDLDRFFAAIVGGDSLDGVRKPDPRLVLAALTRLDATPGASVMVGDNRNDVEAARAAGLRVIVRAGGYSRVPAADLGADAVIARFDELPAALARLP